MKDRILAVMDDCKNYLDYYEVSYADSYEEAKIMIEKSEQAGTPYHSLNLNVKDEESFWEFLDWMNRRYRKYPFAIFGCHQLKWFMIKNKVKAQGFSFRD